MRDSFQFPPLNWRIEWSGRTTIALFLQSSVLFFIYLFILEHAWIDEEGSSCWDCFSLDFTSIPIEHVKETLNSETNG